MPRISEMLPSRFLKKEDVDPPVLATIAGVLEMNVAAEGAPPEKKWCMTFHEMDKPLVLNNTNLTMLGEIMGSDDSDEWIGKKVVLFNDPNVQYAGRRTGGIRIRAPKQKPNPPAPAAKPAPKPAPAPSGFEDMDDDIPY